jgi:hypothetical protein
MIECATQQQLVVVQGCDCTVDWANNPGSCRLRLVGYVDGQILHCAGSVASGLPAWTGTFPTFIPGQYFAVNSGVSFNGTVDGGNIWCGAALTFIGGTHWGLSISSGNPCNGAWVGTLNSVCPIGIYVRNGGCNAGPATLTLEGFTP